MNQGSSASTTGKARRKNTTKACEECRRRRSKCDGERPACSRCTNLGLACRYAAKEDGRQPAPKSYVILLRRRIQMLEDAMKIHGIDVQATINQSSDGAADSGSTVSHRNPRITRPRSAATTIVQHDGNSIDEPLSSALKGVFITDESLSFDTHGEPRYFGSVSGRPEISRANESVSPPSVLGVESPKSLRSHVSVVPRNPGLEVENLISTDLKNHLLDLYFTWQHPWFLVVSENLFRDSEAQGGRYCSPLLLNAMFAMGSRFSERVELRSDPGEPQSSGKIFLERAEALLPSDLKWPSVTTIQSLCILATVVIAHGSDASGWLYQGMAKTLALDMGLNIDPIDLSKTSGLMKEEIDLRRQIYWSLYCDDKLSALYTGRVCTMLDAQANVQLPRAGHDSRSLGGPDNNDPESGTESSLTSYAMYMEAFISLCRILETILMTLYAPRYPSSRNLGSSFLESCMLDLKNWSYDLPNAIKLDRARASHKLPHVFILHMVYNTTHIIVARFFSAHRNGRETGIDKNPASGKDGQLETTKHANKICCDAAREVCNVAIKYRQTFGSFRQSPITATHCTLSAALVLLRSLAVNVPGSPPTKLDDQINLKLCLTVLDELSHSWHPAKRFRLHILNLLETNQLRNNDSKQSNNFTFSAERVKSDLSGDFESDQALKIRDQISNNVSDTTDRGSMSTKIPIDAGYSLSSMEFDFNNLNSHPNGWEDMGQDLFLPMDYFNFDTTNSWSYYNDLADMT